MEDGCLLSMLIDDPDILLCSAAAIAAYGDVSMIPEPMLVVAVAPAAVAGFLLWRYLSTTTAKAAVMVEALAAAYQHWAQNTPYFGP